MMIIEMTKMIHAFAQEKEVTQLNYIKSIKEIEKII